jgi:hypothetical protein
MPMECAEAKDYDFEDVCETGAIGCGETCIWSMEQLWNILSSVRRGLCCNKLHWVGENSNLFGGWKRILSCRAAIPFLGTLPLSGIHLSFFIVSIFVSVLVQCFFLLNS